MRMKFIAGTVEFLFSAGIFFPFDGFYIDPHGTCQYSARYFFAGIFVIFDFERFNGIKKPDNVFPVFITEGTQKYRTEYAFFAVNLRVDKLTLLVDFKFQPGTPVRNDPRGKYAFFMAENNAGRTVNLRNNDALGPVNNEGSPLGHDGDIPHVNVFLADFSGLLEDQVDPRFQRQGIGKALLLAVQFREFDVALIQGIIFVLKNHISVWAFNGKGRPQHFFQPLNIRFFAGTYLAAL